MKRILFALILPLALYAEIVSEESKIWYDTKFAEALRVASYHGSPHGVDTLTCETNKSVFVLHVYSYDGSSMFKEIYEEDYNKLKNKGIDDKTIFAVAYVERKDRETKTLRNKLGILHIDSPSRFHFSFLNDPTIFNLELIDPNMKPITINNLPENGRIVDEDYGAIFIIISNAVYLWENNATDQKMTCNIHVYVSVTRDW